MQCLSNDPLSPKERQRVTRCFTKWHREEISGPPASLHRSHIELWESLSRVCCTWGSRLTCSRSHTFSLWHTCRHLRRLLAAVVDVDVDSGRGKSAEAWQRGKNKASLACSIQKLFSAACRKKKWRYDDALRYALCIRKDELKREGR